MTFPAGMDPELIGTTKPEVLQLALSGHLAAAAGGESHISLSDGLAAVEAIAPVVGWEGAPEVTYSEPGAAEAPAQPTSTTSTTNTTSTSSTKDDSKTS